jgi:hypothetical protein
MAPYRCWCVICDFQEEAESPAELLEVVNEHLDDFGIHHSVNFELAE